MSDIAVRILHTRYDHLSLLARMARLRIHTPSHRYLPDANATNTFTVVIILLILIMFSLRCVLDFPHPFGPRSLAGGTEVPADVDVPEQGETKGEGEEKEENETQQQREEEEVQSIQGSEWRKVRLSCLGY